MPLGRRSLKQSVTDCPRRTSVFVPHTWRSFSPAVRMRISSLKTRPNGKRRMRTEQGTAGRVSLSRFVLFSVRDRTNSRLSKSSRNLTRTFRVPGADVTSSNTLMSSCVLYSSSAIWYSWPEKSERRYDDLRTLVDVIWKSLWRGRYLALSINTSKA